MCDDLYSFTQTQSEQASKDQWITIHARDDIVSNRKADDVSCRGRYSDAYRSRFVSNWFDPKALVNSNGLWETAREASVSINTVEILTRLVGTDDDVYAALALCTDAADILSLPENHDLRFEKVIVRGAVRTFAKLDAGGECESTE